MAAPTRENHARPPFSASGARSDAATAPCRSRRCASRSPDFAPGAQSIWRSEPQCSPLGVGGQREPPGVDHLQQSPEGLAFVAGAGGLQRHDDGLRADADGAGRGEEVGERALGLGGLAQVLGEEGGEFALDVRAGDADRVERGLVLVLVANKDVGEFGLAERRVGRCLGPLRFEGLLLGERLVEVALPACAPLVVWPALSR